MRLFHPSIPPGSANFYECQTKELQELQDAAHDVITQAARLANVAEAADMVVDSDGITRLAMSVRLEAAMSDVETVVKAARRCVDAALGRLAGDDK